MNFKDRITLTTLGYMILGIIVIFLLAGVYTFFKVEGFSENLAYQNAMSESQRYAETLKSFRGIYTSEVISTVLAKKQMKITHDYKNPEFDSTGAIPLPATLSMLLAEKMTTGNTTVKLYSKYPFPWRRDRTLTDFEVKAFDYFEANRDSDEPYFEEDRENGVVRYAIPDKMVAMTCVNCHNNHPQSPKTGWSLGDVRGAISIVKPVSTSSISQASSKTFILLGLTGVAVLMALWIVIGRIRSVRNAIQTTKSTIEKLKGGDLEEKKIEIPQNEMREVALGLNALQENFRNVASFAQSIGKGELNTDFQKLSDRDALGIALIEMRNNLKKINDEDDKRNWVTTGLAQLGETLRKHQNDTGDLYDKVIQFVVKYTRSNQGGLFILNEDDDKSTFLDLKACYAYERKKFISKKIEKGQGLVGQCFLEGGIIHLTEIPKEYAKITSGLGAALPDSLLLVPLLSNEKVFGVLELLSFTKYEAHEMEFMAKAAESIASIISTAKVNERTRMLLQQAQQQTEEMKSQEEEMRQNMEEMQATQEEVARKERDSIAHIRQLEAELAKLKTEIEEVRTVS